MEQDGQQLMVKNRMLRLAFRTMPQYLIKLEDSPEGWHLVPIRGHWQVHKIFPFYPAALATLETHCGITVSQIFFNTLKWR
jgi:hypothetical protein